MITGNIGVASNKATWTGFLTVYDADTNEQFDISAATEITVSVRDPITQTIELTGTLTGGEITLVSDTQFSWVFTKSQMSDLCAKIYEVGATIEFDDDDAQLIIGTVSVLDGIVS